MSAADQAAAQPIRARHGARDQRGHLVGHPKEVREHAFRLYKDGHSQIHIAHDLGIPVGTVYGWCKRDHWDMRAKAERAGVDAETAPKLARVLTERTKAGEPSNLDLAEKQARYQALMGDAALRVAEHVATLEGDKLVASADKLFKADQIARKALKLETEKPSTVIQIGVLANSPAKQDEKRIESASAEVNTLGNGTG